MRLLFYQTNALPNITGKETKIGESTNTNVKDKQCIKKFIDANCSREYEPLPNDDGLFLRDPTLDIQRNYSQYFGDTISGILSVDIDRFENSVKLRHSIKVSHDTALQFRSLEHLPRNQSLKLSAPPLNQSSGIRKVVRMNPDSLQKEQQLHRSIPRSLSVANMLAQQKRRGWE